MRGKRVFMGLGKNASSHEQNCYVYPTHAGKDLMWPSDNAELYLPMFCICIDSKCIDVN